jgi:ABC-type Zn uptake system ZnuABC Zn-binding protein ZnuA
MRRILRTGLIGLIGLGLSWLAAAPGADASEKVRVVATLSTFADLAAAVGGEQVDVSRIASPQFNPHFIEPKPSDVLKVKRADLFIHAGLDLELWRWPLLDAAGNTAVMPGAERELDLSHGIALLEVPTRAMSRAEGDIHLYGNPHYWLDPEHARVMAPAVCDKLCAIDPQHEQAYHARLREFLAALEERIPAWKARMAPFQGRELVAYHNEWPYLMAFAGLRTEQFLEPKPGIPPTPKHVEFLERYLRQHHVPAIVQATYLYGNPHYWLDPEHARVMAPAVCDKLCAIDPQHEQAYHARLREFLAALEERIPAWKARMAPFQGRELVAYHNEWPYLMAFAGLRTEQFLEPKPGIPPTPKHVEFLERYLRQHHVPAIVQATYQPKSTSEALARRAGTAVVALCQNVGELPACSDYLAMVDYNISQLERALGAAGP